MMKKHQLLFVKLISVSADEFQISIMAKPAVFGSNYCLRNRFLNI